jgi:hypothetical protein
MEGTTGAATKQIKADKFGRFGIFIRVDQSKRKNIYIINKYY